MKNCKGNYVKPANQLCAEVLETIDNLISEITDAHVLYKKCVVATPKPIDDAVRRKFLLEESIERNEAPGLDCFTYGYYLAYFWMNNRMTRDALGIKGVSHVMFYQKFLSEYSSRSSVKTLKSRTRSSIV
uniref:Uncharacterized protein n=1 Tax=Aegilops tauschii subsp. strangulata TaxID=200361 RepID=A0A453HA71_AEGTS